MAFGDWISQEANEVESSRRRMEMADRAHLEALLERVPAPTTREVVARYAKSHGADELAGEVMQLPRRRFSSLDDPAAQLRRRASDRRR